MRRRVNETVRFDGARVVWQRICSALGDISECDLRWTLETGDIDADGNDTPAVRACRAELARRGVK
jgi:hypothetical protein